MLEPIPRQSVADAVYAQLRDQILSGALAPGDALPGERRLAETFQVNRGAVREGLRRLAHARLIHVHHGGSTRVLDFREAGLDLLADLLVSPTGELNVEVVRSVLEMRNTLAPIIARLAAERATPEALGALEKTVGAMGRAADPAAMYAEVRTFWKVLAEGSGNLALRLALNSLQQGTGQYEAQAMALLAAELESPAPYARIVRAIGNREADAAADEAAALVARTAERGQALLDQIGRQS